MELLKIIHQDWTENDSEKISELMNKNANISIWQKIIIG
jgi:hypothetical protein